MFDAAIADLLRDPKRRVSVLTGAGISAESGIPTFRGPEGYWTIGSTVYTPQEVATYAMFTRHPEEVWSWYLYRFTVCLDAAPNAGHLALVELERKLGDRFTLITQNIDNLHLRAGNSRERTFQIHGNINHVRCANECSKDVPLLAEPLRRRRANRELSEAEWALLRCTRCRGWLRPHVLWFDEFYDEEHFRFESSVRAASDTDLLIIVGTSGSTTLPNHVASIVHQRGGTILDINIEESAFTPLARSSNHGAFIKLPAARALPALARLCR
jgi:NAD-dependent deacetylase